MNEVCNQTTDTLALLVELSGLVAEVCTIKVAVFQPTLLSYNSVGRR